MRAWLGCFDAACGTVSWVAAGLDANLVHLCAAAGEAGILQSPRDGDIGAVFGFGYPPMRGGPFRHLDSLGAGAVLTRLAVLRERHGDAYNAPELAPDRDDRDRPAGALRDRKSVV